MPKIFKKADKIYSQAFSSKNYNRGIEALSEMIVAGEDTGNAFHLRSHLHSIVGNKAQAKCDLDEAIKIEPRSKGLHYDRACLYQQMKEYYLALKDFCEALNLAHIAGDDDLIHAVGHHFNEILEAMVNE